MKNKTIFVACDTSNPNQIKKIIEDTKTDKLKIIPKFGLQFFYSKGGRKFLENFKQDFWLDLKINDIPQTALSAVDSLKDLKRCKYITVHANGGLNMLKAIKKKTKSINKRFKLAIVKSKLLKQLSDNYPNFLKRDLEKFTNIILNEIKRALKRGDRVELRGFGVFSTNIQKARISRNPKTGEKVNTPEKKTIHFKMSKDLFKKLNDET